jgi:hypothetical protein
VAIQSVRILTLDCRAPLAMTKNLSSGSNANGPCNAFLPFFLNAFFTNGSEHSARYCKRGKRLRGGIVWRNGRVLFQGPLYRRYGSAAHWEAATPLPLLPLLSLNIVVALAMDLARFQRARQQENKAGSGERFRPWTGLGRTRGYCLPPLTTPPPHDTLQYLCLAAGFLP